MNIRLCNFCKKNIAEDKSCFRLSDGRTACNSCANELMNPRPEPIRYRPKQKVPRGLNAAARLKFERGNGR